MASHTRATELLRELKRSGFTATHTRGGHIRIEHPWMAGPVFTAATPSDTRASRNLRALIRRRMRPTAA